MKALKIMRSALLFIIVAMLCVGCTPAVNNETVAGSDSTNDITDITNDSSNSIDKTYVVEYQESKNGKLEGVLIQNVKKGESTTEVKAVPDFGFAFEGWSDGVIEAVRTDSNVEADILVYPIFKPIVYSITYKGMCGEDELYSYAVDNTNGAETEFNASVILPGYKFIKWSDGTTSETRKDNHTSDGEVIIAYYEEIEYKIATLKIETENKQAITSKEVYLKCTVGIDSENSAIAFSGVSAQIRGRGNYTWNNCPKKSYRLKFDEKRSMLGSDNNDRNWVLLSNGWDSSCARNYLAHELAENFKTINFASMHEFIELYVNGEYFGLYLLCDLIQTGNGRVELDEDLSDPNDIAFLVNRDTYAAKEGKVIDSEYFLLENDYNHCFEIEFPETDSPDYKADVYVPYIKNYLKEALDAINSGDWELIQQYVDVENFAEMYIIQECLLNLDVGWNSFYMYKDKGGRLCMGPVWDFDLSAGNYAYMGNGDGEYYDAHASYDLERYETLWGLKQHTWLRRMSRVEEFVELLQKKLDELDSTIKQVYEQVNPANPDGIYQKNKANFEKNIEKWGIFGEGSPYLRSLKTMEEQHKYLYDWLLERLKVVRTYYGMPAEKEIKQ